MGTGLVVLMLGMVDKKMGSAPRAVLNTMAFL
jgi:hypothetical protein